jgi:hypothetical protein
MRRLLLATVVILATVITVSVVLAQSGPWEILWHTIDGGGTRASSGGEFALSSTLGQPDAGTSSGGIYAVRGGFWEVRSALPLPSSDNEVYLPLIRR